MQKEGSQSSSSKRLFGVPDLAFPRQASLSIHAAEKDNDLPQEQCGLIVRYSPGDRHPDPSDQWIATLTPAGQAIIGAQRKD